MNRRIRLSLYLCSIMILVMGSWQNVFAACLCSPNETWIAIEYIANSCPSPDANDSSTYYYIADAVSCASGTVRYYTGFGDTFYTPVSLASYYRSNGYRVIRNQKGTHMFIVMPYYQGSILGINVSSLSPGIYIYPELDQYCLNVGVQDNDNDGFPICFDCNDNDPAVNPNGASCEDNTPKNLGPMCSISY